MAMKADAATIQHRAMQIAKLLGDWEGAKLRPGVKRVDLLTTLSKYLTTDFEPSGRRASTASVASIPLIMVECPNDVAIQRILVSLDKYIDPSRVNVDSLRNDLQMAFVWLQIALQLESKDTTSKRYAYLVKIKKSAQRLRTLLAIELDEWKRMDIDWRTYRHEQSAARIITGEDPETRAMRLYAENKEARQRPFFKYHELLDLLGIIIDDTESLAKSGADRPLIIFQPNPIKSLIQGPLTAIYNKHIDRWVKANVDRKARADKGPFYRFAREALKAMGFDLKLSAISRNVRDIKARRTRRKSR